MSERKKTITTITGEDKEVTIGFLSFQKRNEILRDNIEFGVSGTDLDVKKIDYFGLTMDVLKATVKGCKIDEINSNDGDLIFNEYFKDVLESIGGGSAKN